MNSLFRRYSLLATAAVLVFASATFAQTTQLTLTGVGDGAVVNSSTYGFGVYVDPYTATVGGVAGTAVICDDWSDNTYFNESWTANVISLASLNAGTNTSAPMFGANPGTAPNPTVNAVSQVQLYDELAWLGTQLLGNPNNYANQVATSFALWELTYNAAGSKMEKPSPYDFLTNSNTPGSQASVQNLLNQAYLAVTTQNFTGDGQWSILTPITGNPSDPITCNGGSCPSTPPQEFLVHTPESSAVILFSADMIGLLALAFVFRRRLLSPLS